MSHGDDGLIKRLGELETRISHLQGGISHLQTADPNLTLIQDIATVKAALANDSRELHGESNLLRERYEAHAETVGRAVENLSKRVDDVEKKAACPTTATLPDDQQVTRTAELATKLEETETIVATQQEQIQKLNKAVGKLMRRFEAMLTAEESPRAVDLPRTEDQEQTTDSTSLTAPKLMNPIKTVRAVKKLAASLPTQPEGPRHYHEPTAASSGGVKSEATPKLVPFDPTNAVSGNGLLST